MLYLKSEGNREMTPEIYYELEQEKLEQQQESLAEEWGFACLELAELVRRWGKAAIQKELDELSDRTEWLQPQCGQCMHWNVDKNLALSNGNRYSRPGFCELRASADLEQKPQNYAAQCPFFDQLPF